MKQYNLINNVLGWLCALIAFGTYFSTMEPTSSFWDCGEFIASSYKLQVGHPPGAPLFLMIGRLFSLMAGGDVTMVAYWINMVSVLSSALTIAFLFWTITILARKIIYKTTQTDKFTPLTQVQQILVFGSAFVGAVAYTFTDTFWFSAVEGEVYATSSLFTAMVFWAMLRWEEVADEPGADRWIVLIAYLMGLSIGIHLLNLLTIPALAYIYYFRRYTPTRMGIIGTAFLGFIIIIFIQYGIIPGFVRGAGQFEMLFVNTIGLPFLSGLAIFSLLIIGYIGYGIYASHRGPLHPAFYAVSVAVFYYILSASLIFTLVGVGLFAVTYYITKDAFKSFVYTVTGFVVGILLWEGIYKNKSLDKFVSLGYHTANSTMNLIVVCFGIIILGYSSYALIIIRSNANTPMDENNPADMFSLLSYLNREQYGSQPLFYGQYYDAKLDEREPYKDKGPIITRAFTVRDGKDKLVTYFTERFEADRYMKENADKGYKLGNEYIETDRKTEPHWSSKDCTIFPRMWSSEGRHVKEYKYWGNVKGPKPKFGNNLLFFWDYHIRFMYNRYFLWNFVGRQSDIQGNGEPINGNWISGISFIDKLISGTGPQDNLPESMKNNPGRNTYFFLPLILGLLGLYFHFNKDGRSALIVFMLFFLTGLAIVLYLNQTPLQPRERDYAYAGSFYAFCIWVGLGVFALFDLIEKSLKSVSKPAVAVGVTALSFVAVPVLLANQNWDDHNRAKRYTARDFAYNYLNSCAKDAVIFTNGDNDTFPLWYLQEVEGVRTDVRVINLSLLNTDWYIDQMKRAAYDGKPVDFGMDQSLYLGGLRDQVLFDRENPKYYTLEEHFDWLKKTDGKNEYDVGGGQKLFFFKSNKFVLPIDSAKVATNGSVPKGFENRILPNITFTINRPYLLKSDVMILAILSRFAWDRPVYFAITVGDKFMGLEEYFQLEGLAYRLVPYKAQPHDNQTGEINTEIMYRNIMENFKWGNMNEPGVYLDETNLRMTYNFRNNFVRLASALAREGKSQKAIAVLDKADELMPDSKVSYNYFNLLMADLYIDLREYDKAEKMLSRLKEITDQDLNYYSQFTGSSSKSVEEERRRADLISNSCTELLRKIQFKKSSGGKSVEGATAISETDSIAADSTK